MHIPKLFAVFSLGAFCAVSVHAQRPDSPDQIKAREALHQALGQADAKAAMAPTNVVPPVMATPTMAPPPVQTQVPPPQQQIKAMEVQRDNALKSATPMSAAPLSTAPPPPMAAPVAMAAPMAMPPQNMPAATPGKNLTPEQEEQAREAMRKAMDDLNAKQMPAPAAVIPPPAKPVTTAPAAVIPPPAKPLATAPAAVIPPPVKTTPPPAKTTPPVAKPAVVAPATAAVVTNATPATGSMPVMPEAGSKEARLAELLQLYKAGSITPTEYQERRAKIRAEPDKQ
jgi:hypothetical protein